jgi:hypothetical protein
MIRNNSLLYTSQELFTPGMVQKVTEITGESFSKVRETLMSVVPILTSKILERGTTFEGASHILEVVKEDSEKAEIEIISNEIITDSISAKILKIIGPKLFKPISQKVHSESLSAHGLMRYFETEKSYAAGLSPETSEYYELTGENPFRDSTAKSAWVIPWYALSFLLLTVTISAIVVWLDRIPT